MFSNMAFNQESTKFRVGILLIILWWVPFWALATPISDKTGIKISVLTIIIMGIQTVLGLMGFYLTGKTVSKLLKSLPFKKVPGALWYMLTKGKTQPVDK
jgi:nitrate reductase gamma subunit